MKIKIIIMSVMLSIGILNALNMGEKLPDITLEKDNGGNSAGQAWQAKTLKGKVHVVLYMDPDERKEAMPFLDRLNNQAYDKKRYSTVAIVNLAATWMPDTILEAMLSKKQKELHNTEFIFDKTKYLVKEWHVKDDASNVLIVDDEMKVVYQNSGKLSVSEIDKIMDIISKNIK